VAKDVTITIGAKDSASAVLTRLTGNVSRFASKAGASFQRVGAGMSQVGRSFAKFGLVAGAGLAVSVKAFASFDDAIQRVSAVSGAAGKDLDRMREKAKELGSTTSFSAAQAAEGMQMLGQAGFDTNEILAGIGPTLALAAAGGLELKEAADIASDVGSAFGLTAAEIARVSDVMAVAATSTNTNVSLMGETFKNFASTARVAGQDIEEASVGLGILGNSGVKAADAGTQLKIVFQQMVKEKKALEGLGVSAVDADGNFRDLMDVMLDLGKVTSKMSEEKRLATLMQIFGRGARAAAILTNSTTEEVDKLRLKMREAEGAAKSMAETMLSGLGGAGVKIKSALEGVQIALIESFQEPLKKIAANLQTVLGAITRWIQAHPILTQMLVAGAISVGAFGGSLMILGNVVRKIGFAITFLGGIVSTFGTVVGMVFTPMGAIVLAVLTPVLALTAGWVLMSYKTGLLQEQLKALKDLFLVLLDAAKQTFKGITDAIKSGDWELAGQIGMAGLKLAFFAGLESIQESWKKIWPLMLETAKEFFTKLLMLAVEAGPRIAMAIRNPAGAAGQLTGYLASSAFLGASMGDEGDSFLTGKRKEAQAELTALTTKAAAGAQQAGLREMLAAATIPPASMPDRSAPPAPPEQKQMVEELASIKDLMQKMVDNAVGAPRLNYVEIQ